MCAAQRVLNQTDQHLPKSGNQITIFTGSNSWAYTPLGSIEGTTSELLLEAFGGNAVDITLSLT